MVPFGSAFGRMLTMSAWRVPVVVVEGERADAKRARRRGGGHERDHRGELLAEGLADEVVAQEQGRVPERLRAAGLRHQLLARANVLADHAEPEPPPCHVPLPPSMPGHCGRRPRAPAGGFRTSRSGSGPGW